MFGYATDLRSITQGRAVFHMEFSSFKEVPNSVREEIIENLLIGFKLRDYRFEKYKNVSKKDIVLEGRNLSGIHFAMDFLTMQNKINSKIKTDIDISAKDKNVVVLGGGDTGSDCIGTSNRQGAKSVLQLELLPRPPLERDDSMMWPLFASTFKTSSSHEEGCDRKWGVMAKEFVGNDNIEFVKTVDISWDKDKKSFYPIKNSEKLIPCDLLHMKNQIYFSMINTLSRHHLMELSEQMKKTI